MRKPVMAGNWKMYKNASETAAFLHNLAPLVAAATHAKLIFPFHLVLRITRSIPSEISLSTSNGGAIFSTSIDDMLETSAS